MKRVVIAVLAVIAAGALVSACGSSDSSDDKSKSSSTTAAAAKTLDVTKAWARTSPSVAGSGAAYMTITNGTGTADALVKASVPTSVAKGAELHETTAGDMGSSTTMGRTGSTTTAMGSPTMSMHPVSKIEIPAGQTVMLKPGGYHVMLMDLAAPLAAGQTFDITLTFETAGEKTVTATVSDTAP